MKTVRSLWYGIGALIILSPLGLILPERLKAGSAWGEWGTEEMKNLVGYIPRGMEKLSSLWQAPFPDYTLHGWEEKGLAVQAMAYILSATIGIGITAGIAVAAAKFLARKK